MRTSFTTSPTPGQWLAHSFGWVMSCLGGWLLLVSLLLASLPQLAADYATPVWGLVLGVSAVAHGLIWHKAWVIDWPWHPLASRWLLEALAKLWLLLLTLFQVMSLLLLLGALGLLLGWDTGGDWGSPNTH